jgi:hypothetical protein
MGFLDYMDKYNVEHILKQYSITAYLEDRGIFPKRKSAGKWCYHCPVHEGDNDPSFVVYVPEDSNSEVPENYFCYGCHSGYNIINLVSDMEKITLYQAYLRLLEGVNIDPDHKLQYYVDKEKESSQEFDSSFVGMGYDDIHRSELLYLQINTSIRMHLEDIDYDDDEILKWEKLNSIIDKTARKHKPEDLQLIHNFLVDFAFPAIFNRVQNKKNTQIMDNPWKS